MQPSQKGYYQTLHMPQKLFPIQTFIASAGESEITVHPHWHKEVEILFFTEGSAMQQVGSDYFSVFKGDLVFIGNNQLHATYSTSNSNCRVLVLQFSTIGVLSASTVDGLKKIDFFDKLKFCEAIKTDIEKGKNMLDFVLSICSNVEDELFTRERLYGLVQCVCQNFGNHHSEQINARVLDMLKNTFLLIDEQYTQNISLQKAASASNLSVTHFSRLFKQATGMTFRQYLNFYRVNLAERMLTSSKSITEIAMDYGFGCISSFIRNYKKYKNCTPSKINKPDKS